MLLLLLMRAALKHEPRGIALMPWVFLSDLWSVTWVNFSLVHSVVRVNIQVFNGSGLHLSVALTSRQLSRLCLLVHLNIFNDSFGALEVSLARTNLLLVSTLVLRGFWRFLVFPSVLPSHESVLSVVCQHLIAITLLGRDYDLFSMRDGLSVTWNWSPFIFSRFDWGRSWFFLQRLRICMCRSPCVRDLPLALRASCSMRNYRPLGGGALDWGLRRS